MRNASAPRLLALGLLLLALSYPVLGTTSVPKVQAGMVVTYTSTQVLSYQSPGGLVHSAKNNSFFLRVVSVDNTTPPGSIQYVETYTVFNNATQTTNNTATGTTVFFDPFDNSTYAVKLALYPFIRTDQTTGRRDLNVSVTVTNPVSGDTTTTEPISVNVTRTPGEILVNFTAVPAPRQPRWSNSLVYDSSNGVMTFGETRFFASNVLQVYTYRLQSVMQLGPPPFPLAGYVVVGAFIVLGIVFVADKTLGLRRHRGKRRPRSLSRARIFGPT